MQKLTEIEKMLLKDFVIPCIKQGLYQSAFDYIATYISGNSKANGNITLNILNFLKENGIDLLHKIIGIRGCAFKGCTELHSIQIPGNIKSIGRDAFDYCSALEKVTIAEGMEKISDQALCFCKVLAEINIPRSVTHIGDLVFVSCVALQEINYNGTREEWEKINKSTAWKSHSPIKTINCLDGPINYE